MVVESFGIHQTIVNGKVMREDGQYTGATSGEVLRSGSA
jgi:N-acyl-D-aspartate/D-glutamate deacylase